MTTVKKLILEVLRNQKEIKECLSPRNAKKAEKYDELLKYLSVLGLTVKTTRSTYDDYGNKCVIVEYSLSPEVVRIDDEGNVYASERFKAINAANLLKYKDSVTISKSINNAKAENMKK